MLIKNSITSKIYKKMGFNRENLIKPLMNITINPCNSIFNSRSIAIPNRYTRLNIMDEYMIFSIIFLSFSYNFIHIVPPMFLLH